MPSLSAQKFLLGFAHALKAEAGIGGLHDKSISACFDGNRLQNSPPKKSAKDKLKTD